jgi:hypothetical protein
MADCNNLFQNSATKNSYLRYMVTKASTQITVLHLTVYLLKRRLLWTFPRHSVYVVLMHRV